MKVEIILWAIVVVSVGTTWILARKERTWHKKKRNTNYASRT